MEYLNWDKILALKKNVMNYNFMLFFAPFLALSYTLNLQAGEPTPELMNCPLVQIKSDLKHEQKQYQLEGQGWIFKDARTTPHQLYVLTPAHVVFGARAIHFSCPDIQFKNKQQNQLQLLGISPTYDLAVLKFKDQNVAKTMHPLFSFNGNTELKDLHLPLDASDSALKQGTLSSFFWIEQNRFRTASAGLTPGGWPKTYSILPYQDEITSLNGVRPGMSGSLLLFSINNSFIKFEFLGMVTKTLTNGPYSISIPFYEILPKLDTLVRGYDPRKLNEFSSLPYVDFSFKKISTSQGEILSRIKVLKIKSRSQEKVLAEDLCPSNQFTTVSDWIAVGGSIADSSGGGSIADSGGGGSIADSDGGANKNFKSVHVDFTRVNGKAKLQRSVFFADKNCLQQGIKWNADDNSAAKTLYGLRLKLGAQESIIPVNSVTDLLRINWSENKISDEYALYGFITAYGIFHSESSHDSETLKKTKSAFNPFSTLCQLPKVNSDFIPGIKSAEKKINELNNKSGFKLMGFESDIFYKNEPARMVEDFQKISYYPFNNFMQNIDTVGTPSASFIGGYTCKLNSDEFSFSLVTQSTFSEERERGYSYILVLRIEKDYLNFSLEMANGKSSESKKYYSYVLNVDNYPLIPNWTQFVKLNNGNTLELHYDPELNTLHFNIQINDDKNADQLLSVKADQDVNVKADKPLKLIRFLYKLL